VTILAHPRVVRSDQERTATTGRSSVPWSAVVTFAIAITCADWFWVMSLRMAAGDIQRTQAPFSDWLRESVLVLPMFVLAVLGAFTLALRRFGPRVSTARNVLTTSVLIVSTTTAVGIVGLLGSSVYDYYLQSKELLMMDSMRRMCVGNCDNLRDATFSLQVHSVGYGSLMLLVTNIIVVGWIVAMKAGRLTLSNAGEASTADRLGVSRLDDVRVFLAAGLVGSAAIHAAVVPHHLSEWAAAGVFFVVLAAAELGLAMQVGARVRRGVLLAVAALSAGPLLLWAYSRTFGVPFGPEAGVAESIGVADCAAGLLEIGTLVAAVALLRRTGWLQRQAPVSAHARWLVILAVVSVMLIGLGGTELGWFSYYGDVTPMVHSR
jgi:hypothetical protein